MSEICNRKIYAGYYYRYDWKPFYVVTEATDYDTAVGMIDIPTEKEIHAMMEEIRKNPQSFKFVA